MHWDFVHGLFENAIYGGRVDNNFDVRVLNSYLRQYFADGLFSGQVRSTNHPFYITLKLLKLFIHSNKNYLSYCFPLSL